MNRRVPGRLLRPIYYDRDRFIDRILFMPNGCWEWQGALGGQGYGTFCVDGKNRKAHRWAYEWLVGEIPDGLHLDHLCRNRCCVNPTHLEPVTMQENIARGVVGRANREKTHCPRGHQYDAFTKNGRYRRCKTCERAYATAKREAKRVAARV